MRSDALLNYVIISSAQACDCRVQASSKDSFFFLASLLHLKEAVGYMLWISAIGYTPASALKDLHHDELLSMTAKQCKLNPGFWEYL